MCYIKTMNNVIEKILKEKILKKAFAKIAIYVILAAIVVIVVVAGLIALTVWLIGNIGDQYVLPQIEEMVPALPQIEEMTPAFPAIPLDAGTFVVPDFGTGFEELGQELINIGETIDQIRP